MWYLIVKLVCMFNNWFVSCTITVCLMRMCMTRALCGLWVMYTVSLWGRCYMSWNINCYELYVHGICLTCLCDIGVIFHEYWLLSVMFCLSMWCNCQLFGVLSWVHMSMEFICLGFSVWGGAEFMRQGYVVQFFFFLT